MDAVVADRLLPNLFLLGNPKSGSTFLFGCLRSSFAPNLVCGTTALPAWRTCEHSYVLTALGSKKEFNFWGSTGRRWGLEWYAGPSLPLSAWEWLPPASAGERPWRRGENHELEPSRRVTETCLLNASAPGRAACARFPLECVHGTPVVRPGCGVMRPHPSRRACAAAGGARACAAPRVFMSHAFPRRAEVAARAYALDPSINTFMFAPMWIAAAQRLRPIRPPARPRQRQVEPRAASTLGQPRPIGRYALVGWPAAPALRPVPLLRCAPAAPSELAAAHGAAGARALRFVTLLRDPIARAASSVRCR